MQRFVVSKVQWLRCRGVEDHTGVVQSRISKAPRISTMPKQPLRVQCDQICSRKTEGDGKARRDVASGVIFVIGTSMHIHSHYNFCAV